MAWLCRFDYRWIDNGLRGGSGKHDATFQVIKSELSPNVEMFVRFWRVIQRASNAGPEIKRNGVALIRSIVANGISENWLDEVRKLGSELDPIKRRELINVLLGMRMVSDQVKAKTEAGNRPCVIRANLTVRRSIPALHHQQTSSSGRCSPPATCFSVRLFDYLVGAGDETWRDR
jgi:hypothetical protein